MDSILDYGYDSHPDFFFLCCNIASSEGGGASYLVDLEAAAVRMSPGGLPGKELFVDFCHMNWRGYGGMAEAVLATLAEHGLGPTTHASPLTPPTVTELAERFGLPPLDPDNPQRR